MKSDTVKSYCRDCGKLTNHDILAKDKESYRGDYDCDIIYQIVQCRGCETKSFRHVFVDIESSFPISNDQWEVPEDITIYPKAVEGHQDLEDIYELPDIVRKIYCKA